ncbi:MAG: hypothetical protein KAG04_00190 [Mycoplasmataceae bacterium]|nr:hypothetical protein [Mycoplasmataceae bacterium]
MKKLTKRLWSYGLVFLIRSIIFNVALAFSIVAIVYKSEGLTIWAYVAIGTAGTWLLLNISGHITWYKMSVNERALYYAIRKHGSNVVELTEAEVKRKTGQPDIHEIFTDTDSGLEIKMIVNGAATFVNVFIGVKWIHFAKMFNKDKTTFNWTITKEK